MQNNKVIELITIDRRSKTPYDVQIKENIKALIMDQTFYYRDLLPSPNQLAETLNIELFLVESAYQDLVKENHIQQKGSEFEVRYLQLTNYFFEKNTAIYDAILALGLEPSIECVEKRIVELPKAKAQEFGFINETRFLYINRIYKGDQRPIIILENYLPLDLFPDIDQKLTGTEPLNDFLMSTYGLIAKESHRVTKAVNLNRILANYLNEPEGAPSISSTNHVYDQHDRLIDYGRSHSVSSYYFQSVLPWDSCF